MLQEQIELLFAHVPESYSQHHLALFQSFKDALNAGAVRAAEPDASKPSGWRVNAVGEKRHPARISHGRNRGYVP